MNHCLNVWVDNCKRQLISKHECWKNPSQEILPIDLQTAMVQGVIIPIWDDVE